MKQKMMSRRSAFVSLGAIAATGAAAACAAAPPPEPKAAAPATGFEAAKHPEDDWFDSVPGKHRNFIDASTARGAGEAMLYANNLYTANKAGYSLSEGDVAIVVGLRHFATAFAFNDAMWAKHGQMLGTMLAFTDPKTKKAPSTNLLNSADYGMDLPNLGNSIGSVVSRGTRFAVCDVATHFFAAQLANMTKGDADAIYKELAANLIPNSRMVPAGVVAVNRAQEHGYTLLTTL
jgi:hypothetical protein